MPCSWCLIRNSLHVLMAYNSFSCVSQRLPQYHVLSWGHFLRQFEYELPLRVKCLVPTLVALSVGEFCKLKRWNLHRKTGHRVISRGHLFVESFLSGSPVCCLQWCEQHPHGSVAMTFYLSTDRRVFCRQAKALLVSGTLRMPARLFWQIQCSVASVLTFSTMPSFVDSYSLQSVLRHRKLFFTIHLFLC